MATMMDSLIQQMGEQALAGVVADKLGVDRQTARQALRIALPVIIGGLAKNSSKADGARSLHKALEEDHDGSRLDDLGGFIGSDDGGEGNAILEHVLGTQRPTVEREVGRETGLDPSILAKLLPLLAPLVLAYLGRMQRQRQMQPDDLAGFLTEEETHIEREGGLPRLQPLEGLGGLRGVDDAPQTPARKPLGGIAGMLDQDGDGSLGGEAAQVGMGILRKILSGKG